MITEIFSTEDLNYVHRVRSVCRAIENPLRKNILKYINQMGEVNVTNIVVYSRMPQSVISSHLKILRNACLVKSKRGEVNGKLIFYSIDEKSIAQYLASFKNALQA